MLIECGLATAWDLLKGAVTAMKRPVGHTISSKSFADRLRAEVRNLENEAERVHILEIGARNNVRSFYSAFTDWQACAEKALKEARDLLDDFEKATKTCCYGTLPDPYCRYQFSTKAEAEIEVIQELAQNCIVQFKELNDICFIDPAPGNVAPSILARREGKDIVQPTTATASAFSATTSIKPRDDGIFKSRTLMIENIMDALADNKNSVVGVYGMGGVGKSTLLVDVERRIRREKSFDLVAKADVSENPDIKRIQEEIAHSLGLSDIKNEEYVNNRAKLLHGRLEDEEGKKKKVLIILDNLWKGLDLKSVGIPCGHDNKVIGCKLLLTSRDQNVLQQEMGCDRDFYLVGLQEGEARSLFERIVGDKVHDDEFKPLVDEALHNCAGLPILIIAMAKYFKNSRLSDWKDALKQIDMSTNKGIGKEINEMLQFSYDNLKGEEGEEAKSLLRLCVTYGVSKPSFEYLVRYGIGLRLFREDSSMEEARDRLSSLIHILQASSLLLDDEDVGSFKIHDLVREFVTLVASRDHPLLVLKDKDELATKLSKNKLKNCEAICFPYVDLEELPEELDCPKLNIFILFTNNKSLEVPDSYFNSMRNIMVLGLTGIRLRRSLLPFQFLENLNTLCLDDCYLEDVAILGKLKGLQILSLVNSNIHRLPKEIGQLTKLRLLDLDDCSQLQIIEPGVLGSLTKLEELYMEDSFDEWNALELTPATNASLIELNKMKNLCTLHVFIPDPSVLPKDLIVKKLTNYRIRIGNARHWPSKCKGSRTLELKLDPLSNVLWKGCIQNILCKSDDLLLDKLDGSEQSICALSQKGFLNLKHLQVKNSLSIRYIFQSTSQIDFKMLESLLLENLMNLEKICHGHISSKSFNRLKEVRVESCDKMEVLFPLSVVRGLPQLEEIEVVGCKLMRGIVEADECSKVELYNLHVLKLIDLPEINNFLNVVSAPSSSTSHDQVCTKIAFFNGQQVSIPSLESLVMKGLPNLKNIWSDESPLELSNLRSLEVAQCKSLLKIINSRSLVKLYKLNTLIIRDCISMREIFDLDGPSSSGNDETLFELTTLELNEMLSLRHIWNKNPCGIVSFHKLKKLVVNDCDSLGFMFFPSMIKSLAHLRDLTISKCKKMETIIMEEEGFGMEILETLEFPMLTNLCLRWLKSLRCFSHGKCSREVRSQDRIQLGSIVLFNREVAFPGLETLEIIGFDYLEFIFIPSMVKAFTQLKKLSIWYCEKMEAIIMEEEELGMERSETLTFFMLSNLELYGLRSLTCFFRKKYSREARSQDCVKSHSTTLFNGEVSFPSLERLSINSMDNIKKIWDNQLAADSFHNLKSLCVVQCNNLVKLVPSCILGQLLSMEILEARACGLLEVVFELQPSNPPSRHPIACSLLKELSLINLPKLKCVWDKELHCQVKFQCLRSISVSRCESLTSLFPALVANDLIQLEDLKINECGVAKLMENEEGLVPKSMFPKLTSLKLRHLIKLKCIYTGTHALRWPALKTLEVHGCNKVKIFASQPKNEMTLDKQPLFLIEQGTFPNLQELKLDLSKRMEIWHGHYHDEEFLCKLRVLELRHLSKESPMSISRFVESLTNLEKLVVCESYPEEPSSNEAAIEGTSHELKVTLPFLGYIRHLQTLYMSHCDGLSNLFTPTIIENLVALTKLRISNCKILTKVISDEEGEEGHTVAFNQLKYMELDGLIKLRCFSSGGYTLIFPLLEDVIVNDCPKMKFFSKGPIEAPKLERVQVDLKELYGPTKYRYFWEGNLNITLENMCKEMATVVGIKFMRLFEFPELIRNWHGELNPIKSSWRLETLMVDKCPSFINAIPSKLMLALEEMTSLQVGDCESLEEIFNLEGLDVVESTQVLPKLQYINLINLPNLRQLWNKDLQGMMCFNSLYSLTLYKCSNLRHAFVPSMARCLANIQWIEIKECGRMEGVIVDEEGLGSAVEKITFSKLGMIRLEYLPNLTSFLLGKNHMLDCPKMKYLNIAHCPKMRSLTWQSLVDIDCGTSSLFTPQVQFPQLELMALSHMDNLSNIWTNNPQETLTFDYLRVVNAKNCKSLENLFPHWVATSLTQLMEIRVESCRIDRIVSSRDDTPHSNSAQVLFPKLTSLVLHDMPRLQNFCPNLPALNWPFLKELQVTHCDKLNMLSLAASMNSWAQRDDQHDLSNQETNSSFERDFSMLERLLLVDENIQMTQDGKFPKDFFGKPKALTLACFHDEKAVFPSRFFLEKFQNLQSLEVFCSSFEDIFPDEGLVDEGKHSMLENLRELKLNKLHNLKSVWREDSLVSKVLKRIETFEVWHCPCLTTIFPTVTSFQNLMELVVKNSSGLVHLVTTSAVTNLVNLTYMTIIGCERMKEIIANDGNGEEKVISFWKLKSLIFQHLPSLECFSSISSCIFRFPSLLSITVEDCPKIKTFSKGTLSTPKLSHVSLFGYKWEWDWGKGDDLNTTIQNVEKAVKEAEDTLDDFKMAPQTCSYGTLPDPNRQYQFSRKAKHKIKGIQRLGERSQFRDVSTYATTSIKIGEDGVFESWASVIRDIIHALANSGNSVVGVHGMGGVGKSTLLEDAERILRKEKSFDVVAKANVSANPGIKMIQGEIARALGLDLKDDEHESARADRLRRRLENEKQKVLIILDNLWKGLDLKSVGIPCGHDNKVIRCKLLLASRNRDVLRREMGCDTDFCLNVLEEEEAKILFERTVGVEFHSDDEFKPLVDGALNKCAGLPLLIVNMAKYFKDAHLLELKNALKQLKLRKDKGPSEVTSYILQLSYDNLKTEAKSLLRQCVVYGVSRLSLENLLRYSVGWGLFQEDDMEEARERLKSLIRTLQASSFLLESGDAYEFKIHDSVRDFVASFILRDHPLRVLKDQDKLIKELPKDKLKSYRAEELEGRSDNIEPSPPEYSSRKVLMCGGLGLTEPPEVTQWQSLTEIYLMENQLTELPENPRCPVLLALFLNKNCKLRTISPHFFDFMPALEILNLSRTRIKSLPESLFRLSSLKRLFLNHCELLRVLPPKIGELQQLEVLDLEGTDIMDLPKEVAKLTKLTCLEVSFCPCTNCGTNSAEANALIPQGTISALSQLEELSIDIHPGDEGWESVVEAIVDDVCGLMRLDTLKLYFPQVEHLRKWFGTSKVSRSLSHFKFVVGKHAERIMCYLPKDLEFEFEHWDRSLKYVNGVGVPIDIQKMLQYTSAFFLDRHRDVAKLSDFGIENMVQLKCCIIGECKEIKVIVDGTDAYDEADRSEIVSESREDGRRFLGSLEYLYIYRMKSLSCIYEGPLHRGSFSHLKCLALLTCPQLTSIFTPGLLENLDSLEELNVKDCPLVLSLVRCKDTSIYESTCFLPKLKKISLVSLPGLISIFNGLRIAPNLERWSIIGCPKLESPSADAIYRSHPTGPRGTFDESCQFEPPHQAEELEIRMEIESSPPEYSRKVLMRGGLGLTEPPEVTQWQSLTEIYLMENQLTDLPENPRCPVLLALFLNRNRKLRTISPPFFDFMPALEILNLSRTQIKSLPESLFRLSCLKRLFLNHCELLRVLPPQIGELQQLEVLDLEGTEIMDLPKEVAKLTKLTCLEVSFCPCTNYGTNSAEANALIPEGTISTLSQLEELSIDVHPEDERWESVVEAIVDDVCGLLRLDTLRLYFPHVEHLRKFKWIGTSEVSRSLSHFKFVVGKHAERIMCYLPKDLEFEFEHWDRSLKYVNGVGVPIDIQKMLQHTSAFFLDRHRDVAKLSDFGIENMERLKCCIIGECKEIKVIVDGTDAYDEADRSEIVSETQEDGRRFLGSLEYLYIYRMKSLSCIYEGPLHRGSFSHLKCLALLTCPQLTSIFTPGLLENLDSLEELNIEDCPLVLSLVRCKDTSIYESTCFLPKLKKISLVSLPRLISISNGLRIAPNLERWSIIGCPNLESPSAD